MARRTSRVINPVASVRQIYAIVREMSFDDLRDTALRRPRIAVIGLTVEDARDAALEIFGPEARALVAAQDERTEWPSGADIILVDRRIRLPAGRTRYDRVVDYAQEEPVERTRRTIVQVGDDLELALGRAFPALRQAASMQVVNTTSRVNAQFALASNLPALIPVVGGVLSAGADTIVLTKNQLMMIYKLAAIHERDLDNRLRIYQEMVPVVGAGLFWRTVARDLAALLPFAAGAVPKVAIAYAGTFASGMAANVYYTEGKRIDRRRMQQFYRAALRELRERPDLLRSLPIRERLRRGGASDRNVIDVDYRSDTSPEMP